MDIFRFFHPHHNPRLRNVPLRLQELGELEQASQELKRALQRAQLRASTAPVAGISPDHFAQLLVAMDYIVESLETLLAAHPGDSLETILKVATERENTPGWEQWAAIVRTKMEEDLATNAA